MPFFVTFETFPSFLLFPLPAFFGHIAILVAIEVLWFSIFEITVGLFYIHKLFSSSIYHSHSCLVVMSSFCGFLGITIYSLLFVVAGTGDTDISLSDCLYVSSKALFVILVFLTVSQYCLFILNLSWFFLWFIPHMFHLSSSSSFA